MFDLRVVNVLGKPSQPDFEAWKIEEYRVW